MKAVGVSEQVAHVKTGNDKFEIEANVFKGAKVEDVIKSIDEAADAIKKQVLAFLED